jgi:hypothetical protein
MNFYLAYGFWLLASGFLAFCVFDIQYCGYVANVNIQHPTSDIKHQTPNTQHPTSIT